MLLPNTSVYFPCLHLEASTLWATSLCTYLLPPAALQVLGWAFNRGPLALPLNALQFGVVYIFPITPETERPRVATPPPPASSSGEASREADDDPQAKRKVPAAALQPPRLVRPGGRAAVRRSLLNFLAKCVALAGIVAVLMLAPGMHHLVRTFFCGACSCLPLF